MDSRDLPPLLPSRKRTMTSSASAGGGGALDDPSEKMTIMPLGGGQEVGRSCIVVTYRGCTVMLDCGLHTSRKGIDALPFLDIGCDLESVDLLLVTHFHMDHVACLPYLTEHTMFQVRTTRAVVPGRCALTPLAHPTLPLSVLLPRVASS